MFFFQEEDGIRELVRSRGLGDVYKREVLGRLNRMEYENSVSNILGLKFKTPNSFPADLEFHGFDNVGAGLVISPPLMAQYFEVATAIADQISPCPLYTVDVADDPLCVDFGGGLIIK